MTYTIKSHLNEVIEELKEAGLYKSERIITSPQSSEITVSSGDEVINLCANNYLGLADNQDIIQAAKDSLDSHGFGMASVRFICGTQNLHKELEAKVSSFLNTEDTILYSSCFDANAGLFETLLGAEDAIISDELNHASIIDGVRLCKAKRYRYKNNNAEDLEKQLIQADKDGARFKMIATDGVFSMDGIIANLPAICDLAEKYNAMLMVDDSHAVGFVGDNGRGTPEYWGVQDKIDIVTGTFGKALGGASGGYTSGKKEIVEMLRQRSRPYLFSNTMPPPIVAASIKSLDILVNDNSAVSKLKDNSEYFRTKMTELGFDLITGDHAIIPIMLYDAKIAKDFADRLLNEGLYVVAFSFPVVPKEKARIRTQISAAHSKDQLDRAITAFEKIGKELKII